MRNNRFSHRQMGQIIGDSPLAGTPARFLRQTGTGGIVVEIAEDRGAYKKGDQVQVGTGEWKAKPKEPDLHPFREEELGGVLGADGQVHSDADPGL